MNALLKYPGGKWRISQRIIEYFPPHKVYLEPFFGSGAVFFRKAPSYLETINDIDGNVVNLFRVIRERTEDLARLIELTPFSREEFMEVQEDHAGEGFKRTGDDLEDARRFIVRCNQAFGTKLSDRVGWKSSTSYAGPNCPQIWGQLPDTIREAAQRLKLAQIEKMDAVELIRRYNHEECLIYVDPPYIKDARPTRMYLHEMQDASAHVRLLETLLAHRGKFVISGYDNKLYDEYLQGCRKVEIKTYVNSGRASSEYLWMNFDGDITMLDEVTL